METKNLANGVAIPVIGFGTYKAAKGDDREVLRTALECGYRHFDTASFYDNEEVIGKVLAEAGIPREELFLTSKVWKAELGYAEVLAAFERSVKRLGTDYLDLYLIHWPKADVNDRDWQQKVWDTWRGMEELYRAGKIRAIGVSNFLPHHLLTLMERAEVMPMVDQLEIHPGYAQKVALDFCKEHEIIVEGWSPIGRGRVLQEPLLHELAAKYGKSPAQICLRFGLQCDVVILPKASSRERMTENKELFDFSISEQDMYRLMTLPQLGWSGEHPDRETITSI